MGQNLEVPLEGGWQSRCPGLGTARAGSGLQVTSMPCEVDSKLANWSNWYKVFIQDHDVTPGFACVSAE